MVFAFHPDSEKTSTCTIHIFSEENYSIFMQAQMWNSLKTIEQGIKIQKNSTSWRINDDYYLKASDCRIRPGTVSVAPAWFQQAHVVGKTSDNFYC